MRHKRCRKMQIMSKPKLGWVITCSAPADSKLTNGQRILTDISGELGRLQAAYSTTVQRRDEARKLLEKEISAHTLMKWEQEHVKRRGADYQKQTDKLKLEIAALQSHMPMMSEGF